MLKIFLGLFILLGLIGCGPEEVQIGLNGRCMGTSYSIKCTVPAKTSPQQLQKDIDQLLLQFDAELSNWNPKSWITTFNQSSSTEWQTAPKTVIEIVELSLELFQKSRGAFDITVSPLIERWGFGARERQGLPNSQELSELLKIIGSQQLELNLPEGKIRKKIPELNLNASALAKGYGVDLVGDFLNQRGIVNYMVEIGGEVRVQGRSPQNEEWHIGIRKPEFSGPTALQEVVNLKNCSMATSGDYQNFFIENNQSYNHIIDPTSGFPVQHQLCSASVIAPTCALADGLATTCLVLGTKLTLQWIKQFPQCSVYLVERQSDGSFKSYQSENFPLSVK
jgi:FAD:protein FMN transferase